MVREESSGYNIHDGARSCVVSYTLSYGDTFDVVPAVLIRVKCMMLSQGVMILL